MFSDRGIRRVRNAIIIIIIIIIIVVVVVVVVVVIHRLLCVFDRMIHKYTRACIIHFMYSVLSFTHV